MRTLGCPWSCENKHRPLSHNSAALTGDGDLILIGVHEDSPLIQLIVPQEGTELRPPSRPLPVSYMFMPVASARTPSSPAPLSLFATFTSASSLQVLIEATVSRERRGYIAMDDIMVLNYPCCKCRLQGRYRTRWRGNYMKAKEV